MRKMVRLVKIILTATAVWTISIGAAQALPIVIDFNLASAGFSQDSPVAENYFASQDLNLGIGVVTACSGTCISTPAGNYRGALTGNFINNIYNFLSFDAVLNAAVISLFDISNNLVSTLTSGSYTYSGTTGIASFSAALNYDGLYSLTIDNASPNAVPEPASLALLGLGLAGLGFSRRKKA